MAQLRVFEAELANFAQHGAPVRMAMGIPAGREGIHQEAGLPASSPRQRPGETPRSARASARLGSVLPGFLNVFVAAALAFLPGRRIGAIAFVIQAAAIALLGTLSPTFTVMTYWLFFYSIGQHVFMPLQQSVGMELANAGGEGSLSRKSKRNQELRPAFRRRGCVRRFRCLRSQFPIKLFVRGRCPLGRSRCPFFDVDG